MGNNFTYRQGTIKDVLQLKELGIASYGQFAKILAKENWDTLNNFLNNADTWIQLINKAHCFICEDKEELIGMAFLIPSGNPTKIYQADWSYIRMVGVNPKYRGKGIARILTLQCINLARESDEKVVALHTSEFMDVARRIYERLGFIRVREIEPIYGKRYWLYKLDIQSLLNHRTGMMGNREISKFKIIIP